MAADAHYLEQALRLAIRARGCVEPNPVVGCVIVANGRVVGQGLHEVHGGPHAEVNALRAAGDLAAGATLYVTLEPCSTFGKTPPCCDAIIRAGVARVVIGASDPVQDGAARLRAADIDVVEGVLADDCRQVNRPFYKFVCRKRAYVIAKWAMSLDGRIATRRGHSRWISGAESRELVHRWRSEVDVVAVGVGTLVKDDPLLTARGPRARNPIRLVLDSNARTPSDSQLLATLDEAPVWIAACDDAPAARTEALREAGATILTLPRRNSRLDLAGLPALLASREITNVLLEGGGTVLGSAFAEGLIDEVRVFVAPIVIGGSEALSPVLGPGAAEVTDALNLSHVREQRIGDDILVQGYVTPCALPPET